MINCETYEVIPDLPPAEYYEASYAQKLVYATKQDPDGGSGCNISFILQIEGSLQVELLEKSIEALISRHEILRTAFVMLNGELKQRIPPTGPFNMSINHIDISDYDNREKITDEIIQEEYIFPFDLQRRHLVRFTLIRVLKSRFIFMCSMHPIIADDHSVEILISELFTFYNAWQNQSENPLRPLRIQYKDFAAWQNAQQQSNNLKKQEHFWLNYLADRPLPVAFPVDFPENKLVVQHGSMVRFNIDSQLTQKLNDEANCHDASPLMVMLAIVSVLLNRYTAAQDIILGTFVTTRKHPELENQVGLYNNLLPVRIRINDDEKEMGNILKHVRQVMLQVQEYDQYPYSMLIEKLPNAKGGTQSPFINVLLQLQSSLEQPTVPGLEIRDYTPGNIAANTSFIFNFKQCGNYIKAAIEYDTGLYKHATIHQIAEDFLLICRTLSPDN